MNAIAIERLIHRLVEMRRALAAEHEANIEALGHGGKA